MQFEQLFDHNNRWRVRERLNAKNECAMVNATRTEQGAHIPLSHISTMHLNNNRLSRYYVTNLGMKIQRIPNIYIFVNYNLIKKS